jgi:putative restriction endonuclease
MDSRSASAAKTPGYPEGSEFASRDELNKTGVHRPTQAGISGAADEGADSIVVSGGYEDDRDNGDEIIYTGHGGRDPNTGKQIADQQFDRGNKALATIIRRTILVATPVCLSAVARCPT